MIFIASATSMWSRVLLSALIPFCVRDDQTYDPCPPAASFPSKALYILGPISGLVGPEGNYHQLFPIF